MHFQESKKTKMEGKVKEGEKYIPFSTQTVLI